jgi:hypothetical protein
LRPQFVARVSGVNKKNKLSGLRLGWSGVKVAVP